MKPSSRKTLLSLMLLFASVKQAAAAVEPDMNSMSKDIDRVFAEFNQPDSPGCALAVIRNGKTIYGHGYGMASLEHHVPIRPDATVFNIASTSKQFTAASILLLVQEGKLSLDDDVRTYVPDLPDYGHRITIDHLLHHTSGLRDAYTLLELAGVSREDVTTSQQTMALIERQETLNFLPGTEHLYSSSNYYLLGQVVERISGMSLRDFTRTRIFEPLGMRNTQLLLDYDQVVANAATGYRRTEEGAFAVQMSNWTTSGPSGLRTTVEDLAKWDRNFDEPVVGGTSLVERLQAPGMLANGEVLDYASGLFLEDYRGLPTVFHDGSFVGYRAEFLRFATQHVSVIVLCNTSSSRPRQLARNVADIVLGTAFPADTADAPEASTAVTDPLLQQEYTGLFWDRRNGYVDRIEVRDGRLVYVTGGTPLGLALLDDGRLQLLGQGKPTFLSFSRNTANLKDIKMVVNGLGLARGGQSRLVEVEPYQDANGLIESFAGTYYSADLDVRWTLVFKDGHLQRLDSHGQFTELTPAFRDAVASEDDVLRFRRDSHHSVVGFAVDTGRVSDLEFVRVPSAGVDPSGKATQE